MKVESIQDFIILSRCLNNAAVYDVAKRIMDWLGSGGKEDDPYIKQQLDYINKLINLGSKNVDISQLSKIAKNAKEKSSYSRYQ